MIFEAPRQHGSGVVCYLGKRRVQGDGRVQFCAIGLSIDRQSTVMWLDDSAVRVGVRNDGESLYWQFAPCNERHLNLPAL